MMNSKERREGRYQRRKEAREAMKLKLAGTYDCYENVISANALYRAAKQSRKTIRFKASVQRYFMSLLRNIWTLREKLTRQDRVTMGFICFKVHDRGKERDIRSVHFKERVAQRALCDEALVPMLSRNLVYDNGASLANKGIHFALNRCKAHLQKYYRSNGFSNSGWVLLIDFSGYFDNVEHAPILRQLRRAFTDERIIRLTWRFVKCFGQKSLGIGSQVSQILAVSYPGEVDHYAKEVLGLRYGGRYMDDSYYFHQDRKHLEECLEKLKEKYEPLGIRLHPRKTQIIPIQRFTFLKVRFYLTGKGAVVMKPCQASITRMRRKLRKFRALLEHKSMTMDDIMRAYQSWRGYVGHLDSHKTIREMDKLFYELYKIWPEPMKKGA